MRSNACHWRLLMNRYESYKNSEIDWVGEIPSHWETVKPKYKLKRVTRPIEDDDEVITCFRDGVVTLRKKRREDGFTNSIKEHGYQQIRPGDLVVHEMDGFEGAIGISDSKGKSTPVYTVVEPDHRVDLRYITYLLREMSKTGKIESLARSIRERTTDFRWNMWSVIYFPFPPIEEQKMISRYLDKKTEQIDRLVEKIQKKIELLKEQRTSLINQFVTKGLDQNVEMKDSGVKWIGKIPKHWDMTRLKMVSTIINGFAFNSEDFDINNEVPVIRIGDVKSPFDLDSCVKVKQELFEKHKSFRVLENDILVGMTGGTIGKSSYYDSKNPALLNQRVCIFRSTKGNSQRFLSLVILSDLFKKQIETNSEGGGQPNIGREELMNFCLCAPSHDEQIQIADTLTQKVNKNISLIHSEENRLKLLSEYRQPLISSAVTGKFRVSEDMI